MTVGEQRFMDSVSHLLGELVKQLKIMNKLKALELKGREDLGITPEMVDDVIDA